MQNAPPEASVEFRKVGEDIVRIANNVTSLSRRLYSSFLDYLGLAVAAKQLCKEISDQYGLDVMCSCDDLAEALDKEIEFCLYRVLQEALSNSAKHSQAKEINVSIRIEGRTVQLCVSDDGIGFGLEAGMAKLGLGLVNMRERISSIGGDLTIQSSPGHGATIQARVTLPDA